MSCKKIKDLYTSGEWLFLYATSFTGEWATTGNLTTLDSRIYSFFSEKYIDRLYQDLTTAEITAAVVKFLNSKIYELDTLYHTTDAVYNPIENYNLTESGTDETHSSSTGNTADYSTSYNSTTENKTGKSEAGGTSSTFLTHSFSRSGNIGVTTTQQMLQSERDIAHFDFLGYVADIIISNFTVSEYFPVKDMLEVII